LKQAVESAAQPHIVILGGGPAGVGGAFYLHRAGRGRATVLEAQQVLGGNAGSFELDGLRVDYGSHRLHHASDPEILADLHEALRGDLLSVPRRGRIRLRGKWVHFPLKPVDLLLRLDRRFAAGSTRDMVMRSVRGKAGEGETFASVLQANLGPTICEHFYFAFARKIWGREPEQLSGIQARKRVSAGSFRKLIQRLFKPPAAGRFYYPKKGYGQITEALGDAAAANGATILTGTRVTGLEPCANGNGWTVTADRGGETTTLHADYVWSTIPTPLVARMMQPGAPQHVTDAASAISYRAMVLA
jgi:protoporphyrinogen oxidase